MTGYSPSPAARSVAPHRGVLILVLGILGLVVCQLLGPIAWIMGRGDLGKIDAGHMDREGRGLTLAGMILGIVSTCLLVLSMCATLIWFVLVAILFGASAASGSSP